MKVLIFISQLNKGGAERVVSNLSNYLIKNHDVTIAVLRNRTVEYDFDKKITIVNLEQASDSNKNKFYKLVVRYKNYVNLIKNNHYDLILSFLPDPSFISLVAKKFTKSKIVVSVRNDPKIEYKSLMRKILMKLLYKKADGFVFQTQDAKKYFSEEIQKKSKIIMNSIDPKFMCDPYSGERNKEIVSVGRLEKQKNHKLLINAFYKTISFFPDYKLIIYGEGNERKELEKLIEDLNIQDKVLLPGKVDNVKEKIYKAALFVLSSDYEGMPNSLLEALALGIPSISTDCPCGGPREVIKDNQNGFLVPVDDVDCLSKKIVDILKNEELCRQISIKSSDSMKKYNPDIINKEWEDYLEEVVIGK